MLRVNFLIKLIGTGLFFVVFSPFVFAAGQSNAQSVAGYWQTIDGKTHKPSSVIQIEPAGQFYIGKIVKIFSPSSNNAQVLCLKCKGDQKNKPILGLTIVQHMICQAGYCSQGTILDPRNGDVYHSNMQVINGGQALKVRGYVGVPLFGKTVIWHRIDKLETNSKE